jgi:hypothetical protein
MFALARWRRIRLFGSEAGYLKTGFALLQQSPRPNSTIRRAWYYRREHPTGAAIILLQGGGSEPHGNDGPRIHFSEGYRRRQCVFKFPGHRPRADSAGDPIGPFVADAAVYRFQDCMGPVALRSENLRRFGGAGCPTKPHRGLPPPPFGWSRAEAAPISGRQPEKNLKHAFSAGRRLGKGQPAEKVRLILLGCESQRNSIRA